jgi:hypothetical protein
MLSKSELLMGRDKTFSDEYTSEISNNLDTLLEKLNVLRAAYGHPMKVSSGWRPASINGMIPNAAKKSNHMIGLAVDIADADGALMKWCLDNLDLLTATGLYLEDFRYTPTWCHFQSVAPKSKKRIFVPSEALPPAPARWNGRYDSRYDK